MTEICQFCGKQCANTKALGSHIHYMHGTKAAGGDTPRVRSDSETERFGRLLGSCLSERDLPRPREIQKIEQAITEIPPGVSPDLDKYRNAFECALGKERLVEEVEEMLREEKAAEEG